MTQSQINIFILLIKFLIVGLIFQLFTHVTHIPTFWPSVIAIVGFTLFVNPQIFFSKSVIYTVLLYGVLLVFDTFGHLRNLPDAMVKPLGVFSMVLPYFITAIVLENFVLIRGYQKQVISVGKFALYIILFCIAITFFNELIHPGLTRGRLRFEELPPWVWTITFGTLYSLPFVLMTILAYYKGKKIRLFFMVFLTLATLLWAGFLTALAVSIVASIAGLMFRFKIKKLILILSVLFILVTVVFVNLSSIINVLPWLPNDVYYKKANDLSEIQQYNSSSDILSVTRQGVYDVSVNTFVRNLAIGTGDFEDIGQHSYWLDKLGFIGIAGTLFYVLVLFAFYKKILVFLENKESAFYRILMYLLIGFLFFNPIEWPDFWLVVFVFIPAIIDYIKSVSIRPAGRQA